MISMSLPTGDGYDFPARGGDGLVVRSVAWVGDDVLGLASFRVGYVAAPKKKAAKLRSWKQALSMCTAAPSQRAVLVALK